MCITPSWRKWEDVRYPTFLGRRHKSRSWNKMAVFWSYFRDFVGAQKIEDLTESKNFLAELFQITSRFGLAKKKKNWGQVHFKDIEQGNRTWLVLTLKVQRNKYTPNDGSGKRDFASQYVLNNSVFLYKLLSGTDVQSFTSNGFQSYFFRYFWL